MWKSITNQVTDKMKVTILKTDGTSSGKEAELLDTVFGIEPNETILYEDIRRILANRRQGTAKTKERSEVRGGGRSEERRVGKGGEAGVGGGRRWHTRWPRDWSSDVCSSDL